MGKLNRRILVAQNPDVTQERKTCEAASVTNTDTESISLVFHRSCQDGGKIEKNIRISIEISE